MPSAFTLWMRLLVGWTILLSAVAADVPATVIRIDRAAMRQTIEHVGASDCWNLKEFAWPDADKERLARLLFSVDDGIGLSQWRFNLGGGDGGDGIANPWRRVACFATAEGVYDWNRQAGERWWLRAAKRLGVGSFVAFCNSPPAFLTRNGLTTGTGTDASTNLKPGAEPAFARFLGDVLDHFAQHPDPAERIAFDWISPVNEPEWPWKENKQEGCRYGLADIQAVARAVAAELTRRRLATRLLLCESGDLRFLSGDGRNYLTTLFTDPVVRQATDGVLGYHSYWSDKPDRLLPSRQRLAKAAAAHPGIRLWQTEYCVMQGGRGMGMDGALAMARVVHHDLAVAGACSWSWWTAVSTEIWQDGLIYSDWKKPGDPISIKPAKRLWALGHWSRFVRPGMHRVAVDGDAAQPVGGLLSSAYTGEDGRLVLISINQTEEAQGITVAADLPPGRCTSHLTSATPGDDLRLVEHAPGTNGFILPPRSLATMVWQKAGR